MATKRYFQKNFKQPPTSKLCTCSLWSFPLCYLNNKQMFPAVTVTFPGVQPGTVLGKEWVWQNVTLPGVSCHILPALEQRSTKGHYASKLRASRFESLSWGLWVTVQVSQVQKGMSCKKFPSTVGAVFEA